MQTNNIFIDLVDERYTTFQGVSAGRKIQVLPLTVLISVIYCNNYLIPVVRIIKNVVFLQRVYLIEPCLLVMCYLEKTTLSYPAKLFSVKAIPSLLLFACVFFVLFRHFSCNHALILGLGVKCGLSLLLVLVLASRGFSPGTPVFPSPQKPTLLNVPK